MNDDNNSPNNDFGGKNHEDNTKSSSKNKLKFFKKSKNNDNPKSNKTTDTVSHSAGYDQATSKSKKTGNNFIKNTVKFVKNNKLIFLVILIFVIGIAGVSVWYFKSQPQARVLDTNNQVITEYKNKLPELKKAASADANSAAARKNYAVALYVTGNFEAAKNEYEAVVKIDGKDSTAYNNLGNTYRDLGKYDKAKTAYEKSFEINPTSINPYVNLANIQLYTLDNSNDAIATYKKALKAMPNNNQISLLLGMAYEKAGKTTEAKQTFQDILSRNADDKAAKAGLDRLNK